MKKWYVINVMSGKENKILEAIQLELENNILGKHVKQIVIPKEKYYQVRQGKKVKSERNYFPGYIMVEADMNGELAKLIQSVNGVSSWLGGKNPTPLRKHEVENLLGKIDELEGTDDIPFDKQFIVGDRVKIIDGPFSTFIGEIKKIDSIKKSVVLDVNIFNRKTPVELSFTQIDFDK